MNKEAIIAIIANMEDELGKVKQLLAEDCGSVDVNLPSDEPKQHDIDDCTLGCMLITSLKDFYDGKCAVLRVQKRYVDNGLAKVYLDKNNVIFTALDHDGRELGSKKVLWNKLGKYQIELIKRGINTHDAETWMPKAIDLKVE